jgi:hypothetical protein
MNTSTRRTRSQGRCSYCNETNHNIGTCDAYIESIHQAYLDEYIHSPNPTIFLPSGRNISLSHLRLLALKIGLPVFTPRIELIHSYFGRMHTHYLHLADTERQRRQEVHNSRIFQEQLERRRLLPESWSNAGTNPTSIGAIGSPAVPSPISVYYPQYENSVYQNRRGPFSPPERDVNMEPRNLNDMFEEMVVANRLSETETRRKTTVQLHLEPSKFVSKKASDECPVCYESSDNMVLTKCDHLFCQTCMLQMIRLNYYDLSCALCRGSIKDVYVHSDESMDMMFHA